jgi:2-keto-4-pentenoate hydratase/2-oxohepta-3-ene-1,7-dioic acid hydratase in catechol pathway
MAYVNTTKGKKLKVGKVVALAKNYVAHAAEMKSSAPPKPVFFIKPSTSIIHDGEAIVFPEISKEVHHEVELAVVIGKKCKNVEPEEAMKFVYGYAVALDMTARDVQKEAKENSWPWAAAKGFDTSCPIGEAVPKEKVPAPENLEISLKINGQVRQRGSTSMMVHKIAPTISYVSKILTLERGDIILTGTPEGIGPVAHGDKLEAEIQGLPGLMVFVK